MNDNNTDNEPTFKIIESKDPWENHGLSKDEILGEFLYLIHSVDGSTFSLFEISTSEERKLKLLSARAKASLGDNELIKQINSVLKRLDILKENNYPSPETMWSLVKEDVAAGITFLMHSIHCVVRELTSAMGCADFDKFNTACLYLRDEGVIDDSNIESILFLEDYAEMACTLIEMNMPNVDWLIDWKSVYTALVIALFRLS